MTLGICSIVLYIHGIYMVVFNKEFERNSFTFKMSAGLKNE